MSALTFGGVRDSQNNKSVRLSEEVQLFDRATYNGEWVIIRTIGPLVPVKQIWVPFTNPKTGKESKFPKIIGGTDPFTGEIVDEQPYYKWAVRNDVPIQTRFLVNVIIREGQQEGGFPGNNLRPSEQEPFQFDPGWGQGKQTFFIKDIGNRASRTPVRVLELPMSAAREIGNLESLNKVKSPKTGSYKTFGVDHPRWGADLNFMFDNNKTASEKYAVNIESKGVGLKPEDYGLLIWDITNLQSTRADSVEEQEREVARWEGGSSAEQVQQPRQRRKQEEEDVWGSDEKDEPSSHRSHTTSKSAPAEAEDDFTDF